MTIFTHLPFYSGLLTWWRILWHEWLLFTWKELNEMEILKRAKREEKRQSPIFWEWLYHPPPASAKRSLARSSVDLWCCKPCHFFVLLPFSSPNFSICLCKAFKLTRGTVVGLPWAHYNHISNLKRRIHATIRSYHTVSRGMPSVLNLVNHLKMH